MERQAYQKLIRWNNNSLKPIRFSMADYREQDWMINVPLYIVTIINEWWIDFKTKWVNPKTGNTKYEVVNEMEPEPIQELFLDVDSVS